MIYVHIYVFNKLNVFSLVRNCTAMRNGYLAVVCVGPCWSFMSSLVPPPKGRAGVLAGTCQNVAMLVIRLSHWLHVKVGYTKKKKRVTGHFFFFFLTYLAMPSLWASDSRDMHGVWSYFSWVERGPATLLQEFNHEGCKWFQAGSTYIYRPIIRISWRDHFTHSVN